jgi:hypothetical protein
MLSVDSFFGRGFDSHRLHHSFITAPLHRGVSFATTPEGMTQSAGEGYVGDAAEESETLLIDDPNDERLLQRNAVPGKDPPSAPIVTALVVPQLTLPHTEMIKILAGQATVAIRNARLYRDVSLISLLDPLMQRKRAIFRSRASRRLTLPS